ncbi:hypothetical protein [Actinacidiphila sp. ITFR-21]|uniref:hypothetical protein n=1 Tax=Actinacidiphila sp. ITFR-21 TaxID=3075199 RepID=UPI00288BBBDA|nr:hypothetical protein [Streptomyces sp. ITFR-21]WNI15061.1 hypothetical protein RLT57_05605 [Streptomyces sp. ITFR-21]
MPNPRDPRLPFTGQPGRPDDATYRLGGPGTGTKPGPATGYGTGPTTPADTSEPPLGTVLDPDSWSSEVPQPTAPPKPAPAAVPAPVTGTPQHPTAGLRRFGPGVPGTATTTGTAHTAAVWHGTVQPGQPLLPPGTAERRRRGPRSWLLALVVLLAVLAYLLWQHLPGSVTVDSVTVRDSAATQGCHSTAKIIGTLHTSGDAGTVRYRWRRSDGTVSDNLTQHIAKGHRTTDVVLLWSFDGPGSLTATATLDILTPDHRTASTTFPYHCAA